MAVLLGVDVPELPLLLQRNAPKATIEHSEAFIHSFSIHTSFVTTGTGTRRKAEEDTHDSRKNELSGVQPTPALAEQNGSWGLCNIQGGNQRPTP